MFLAGLTPATAVFFSVETAAALAIPYYLTVDAAPVDFDPRPAVRRALESGRLDRLLIAVANGRYHPRHAVPRRRPLARITTSKGSPR